MREVTANEFGIPELTYGGKPLCPSLLTSAGNGTFAQCVFPAAEYPKARAVNWSDTDWHFEAAGIVYHGVYTGSTPDEITAFPWTAGGALGRVPSSPGHNDWTAEDIGAWKGAFRVEIEDLGGVWALAETANLDNHVELPIGLYFEIDAIWAGYRWWRDVGGGTPEWLAGVLVGIHRSGLLLPSGYEPRYDDPGRYIYGIGDTFGGASPYSTLFDPAGAHVYETEVEVESLIVAGMEAGEVDAGQLGPVLMRALYPMHETLSVPQIEVHSARIYPTALHSR
jgi:hypothetical protein